MTAKLAEYRLSLTSEVAEQLLDCLAETTEI